MSVVCLLSLTPLPRRQSTPASSANQLATFWRPRLDMNPVAASSRMLASTIM